MLLSGAVGSATVMRGTGLVAAVQCRELAASFEARLHPIIRSPATNYDAIRPEREGEGTVREEGGVTQVDHPILGPPF